jgi:hypothetical protein
MRPIFFALFFISLFQAAQSQDFVARQSDSAGFFSFVRMKGGRLSRYHEQPAVLQGSKFKSMIYWGISTDGLLYWTNGENVYRCDWDETKGSTQIGKGLHWILEFFLRGESIYIVYNPSRIEGLDDNRFSDGSKLCRIDLKTNQKKALPLPAGYNITNLTISPDMRTASFIHTIGEENYKYKLVLYDISNRSVRIIDSADSKKSEWFGNDDEVNSSYWMDSSTLLYYKHIKRNDYGQIIAYHIPSNSKKIWLKNFPTRDFSWFSIKQNYLYFSGRNDISRTRDGITTDTIFFDKNNFRNILQAILVR